MLLIRVILSIQIVCVKTYHVQADSTRYNHPDGRNWALNYDNGNLLIVSTSEQSQSS